MKYLLDTCVITDFIKGIGNTAEIITSISPLFISISSISVMEIKYGLAYNPQTSKIHIIHDLLSIVKIIPFTEKEAEEAGKIRASLRRKGTPIGAYDVLIASTAIANNITLVTSNTNEFQRIDGLKLENWRVVTKEDAFH